MRARHVVAAISLLATVAVVAAAVLPATERTQKILQLPSELTQWDRTLSLECDNGDQVSCSQLKAVRIALAGDVTASAQMIHDDAEASDAYRARCHDVSHIVGRIATEVIGIENTLNTMSGGCGGGILHGAEEQWGYSRTTEQIERDAAAMCDLLRSLNPAAMDGCAHAIGHALYNAEDDPFTAAGRCPGIFPPGMSESCAEGSVMAYVDQLNGPLDEAELVTAYNGCQGLGRAAGRLCAIALGRTLVRSLDVSIPASMSFCLRHAGDLGPHCALGVGHEAAYQLNPEPVRMVEQCLAVGGPLLDGCLAGGAKLIGIDFLRPELSEEVCNRNPQGAGELCRETLELIQRNSSEIRDLEERSTTSER